MTLRTQMATPGAVELADVDRRHVVLDALLGALNRAVLFLLAFATLAFVLLTISTSAMANALTPHVGPVYIEQRMAFVLAGLLTGAACVLLSRRLNKTWAWSKLPANGVLKASRRGLHVGHAAVLDGEIVIPWSNIKAITMDSGRNHDDGLDWRRFPLPSPGYDRQYLFDTSGPSRPDFALIAARPTAPNIAVLLHKPVALRNPNAGLTEVTFPVRSKSGLPAQPPAGHTAATGLFLRTRNLKSTRNLLLPSGKLRALQADDVD